MTNFRSKSCDMFFQLNGESENYVMKKKDKNTYYIYYNKTSKMMIYMIKTSNSN